jgi:hypothetical protein
MSALSTWILYTLLSVAHQAPDESSAARAQRLHAVADGLASAVDLAVMTGQLPGAERRMWAAAAIATATRESGGIARNVHAGTRLGDSGRSICFMQINRGNRPALKGGDPVKIWRDLAGVDPSSTRRCAAAGVASLARMRSHCARRVPAGDLLGATLSAYMHGSSCRMLAEGARRERLTRQLLD